MREKKGDAGSPGMNLRNAALSSFLLGAALCLAAAAIGSEKLPVPSETAQQQALDLVKQVFGDEWQTAKTNEEKQALARKLFEKAGEAAEEQNRYVLLKVARELAAQGGNAALAFQVIDRTAIRYDVDAYRLRGAALAEAAKSATSEAARSSVARLSLQLMDEAVERDDFDAARYLGALAADTARKAKDYALARQILERNKEVGEIAQAYAGIQDALAALNASPVDPPANLAVGKYRSFVKGDWERGLSMLALGSDEALKKLAVKELAGESNTEAEVALGDEWWELASSSEGVTQRQLQTHAAYWYRRALPGLSGLLRDKVKKRLDSLDVNEVADDREWTAIFDGKSPVGWKADQNPQFWSVTDGAIVGRCRVGQRSFLYYNKRLTDFEATAEVKINETGNSGIYFRAVPSVVKGVPQPVGYEAQVVGSRVRDTFRTGSLHGLARPSGTVPRDDEWFTLHLVAKGDRITVFINDQQVVDYVDKANQYQSGYIALQLWNADTIVCFRNLRIKTLP
jgi:hypothetical protein